MMNNQYVRTNTAEDLVSTLELSFEFLLKSCNDGRYWKWFIYSIHSAAQSVSALSIDGGNGFLVQKPGVMQRMIAAFENDTPRVSPHMDNFSRLIEKALVKQNLRHDAEPLQDKGHTQALHSLDELRDEFMHFNVKSWSIEISLILDISSKTLDFIRHYACATPAILWHNDEHQRRAKLAITSLEDKLKSLAQ